MEADDQGGGNSSTTELLLPFRAEAWSIPEKKRTCSSSRQFPATLDESLGDGRLGPQGGAANDLLKACLTYGPSTGSGEDGLRFIPRRRIGEEQKNGGKHG